MGHAPSWTPHQNYHLTAYAPGLLASWYLCQPHITYLDRRFQPPPYLTNSSVGIKLINKKVSLVHDVSRQIGVISERGPTHDYKSLIWTHFIPSSSSHSRLEFVSLLFWTKTIEFWNFGIWIKFFRVLRNYILYLWLTLPSRLMVNSSFN